MMELIIAILCSTLIFLIFRSYGKFKVVTFPAIIINYIVAMGLGMAMLESDYHIADQIGKTWFNGGIAMGCLFIGLFYLMAYTAQTLGVAVSSVATKMSLVISVAVFMIVDPSDKVTLLKILSVILAIIGVWLTAGKSQTQKVKWYIYLFPLIIFAGSGSIDVLIGIFSDYVETDNDKYLFTSTPFFTSAVIGILVSLIQWATGKFKFTWQTVVGGIVLGFANFGSIYFLVQAYDSEFVAMSSIVSINNLGIIILSALGSWAIFKEQIKGRKFWGIVVAVLAIVILLV